MNYAEEIVEKVDNAKCNIQNSQKTNNCFRQKSGIKKRFATGVDENIKLIQAWN